MNPADLVPTPVPIPVPGDWFTVLLLATFVIHILLMNAVVGGAALALFTRKPPDGLTPAKPLAASLTILLALTINFGVAPFLFLQVNYGHFDYVSSVLMGGWWLAVIGLLIIGYYALYLYKFGFGGSTSGKNFFLAVGLVILLWIAFMFTNNMTLMIRPEKWADYFTKGVFLNWDDPSLYPRWLHMVTAALAVGGLFAALLCRHRGDKAGEQIGLTWFTRGTLVNLAFGIWFLLALPQSVMLKFIGGHIGATVFLVFSLVGAGLILAAGFTGRTVLATGLTVVTVTLMAIVRHYVRVLSLEPLGGDVANIPVTGQYSSLVLFLAVLVLGLGLIWWMVKLALNASAGKEA